MNANVNPSSGGSPLTHDQAFISDLESLRARARDQMMKGAVTPSYAEEDRKAVVDLLEDLPQD